MLFRAGAFYFWLRLRLFGALIAQMGGREVQSDA
jgi:hypothetical protein